jgi:hypothetical protein
MAEDKDKPFERAEDFSTDVQVDKDGVVTLSQDIQDEQEAQGFVPDVQPKSVGTPVEIHEGDPTKTQPTGNVIVAHAVNATAADVGGTPEDSKPSLPKLPAKDSK